MYQTKHSINIALTKLALPNGTKEILFPS